jgi:hypothetical protein
MGPLKKSGDFSVGAPCFSRGKLDFSPAEEESVLKWALAQEFSISGAKAHDQGRFLPERGSAPPPHKCGGSHREIQS